MGRRRNFGEKRIRNGKERGRRVKRGEGKRKQEGGWRKELDTVGKTLKERTTKRNEKLNAKQKKTKRTPRAARDVIHTGNNVNAKPEFCGIC